MANCGACDLGIPHAHNPLGVPPEVKQSEHWEYRVMHGNPDLADIFVGFIGMGMVHNMPCAVCGEKHAVLDGGTGIMQPCWKCQSEGYQLTKKRKRFWK